MFSKKVYIASEVWRNNDYLIQPDTAAKKCACCNRLFYAIEFPMVPEAIDGVIPVCGYCLRSRTKKGQVDDILAAWDIERTCRKCGQTLPGGSFRTHNKARNTIENVCLACTPARPAFWKEKDDEDDFDFENET
jgi:hypothetical protein